MLLRSSLAALVAVALYANTTTTANAWFIAGSELTSTAALAGTASVDEHFKLKAAGVTVECAGSLNTVSTEITANDQLNASKLTFNECSANAPCSVTKTISTVPVDTEFIERTLEADRAEILPKTKSTLATIKYEGAECALLGTQPVNGAIVADFPLGQKEKTLQEVRALTLSGALKVGSSAAEFKGSTLLKLASGKVFAPNLPIVRPEAGSTEWVAGKIPINTEVGTTLTYKNEGPGAWRLTGINVAMIETPMQNLEPFSFLNPAMEPCSDVVAEKTSCNLEVRFRPTVVGRYYGVMVARPAARPVALEGEAE